MKDYEQIALAQAETLKEQGARIRDLLAEKRDLELRVEALGELSVQLGAPDPDESVRRWIKKREEFVAQMERDEDYHAAIAGIGRRLRTACDDGSIERLSVREVAEWAHKSITRAMPHMGGRKSVPELPWASA